MTDGRTDRETDWQTDRQRDRLTDRKAFASCITCSRTVKRIYFLFLLCFTCFYFLFSQRFHPLQHCKCVLAMSHMSASPSVCLSNALIVTKRKFCADFYTMWKNVQPSFPTRHNMRHNWWTGHAVFKVADTHDSVKRPTVNMLCTRQMH